MPTPEQLAELDAIIALLSEHPERHNQTVWMRFDGPVPPEVTPALDCGSAFCIAGATVARAGAKPIWEEIGPNDGRPVYVATHLNVKDDKGFHVTIRARAMELLGLTYAQSEQLFHASNSMDDIRKIRDWIASGTDLYYSEWVSRKVVR